MGHTDANGDRNRRVDWGALVESALEKQFLRALSDVYGDDALTPHVLAGGRRGFILRAGSDTAPRLWTIEPQVQIDGRFRGLPRKRVDFLITPIGRIRSRPIVIEMDGIEYHAKTVDQDLLDRMLMIRSGAVHVWTLAWKDLAPDAPSPRNPLQETALDAGQIGRLSRVLAFPDFASLSGVVKSLQARDSFTMLRRVLDGDVEDLGVACSVLVRSLVGTGQALDDIPGAAALSAECRQFLETPNLAGHAADGGLDLFMACEQVSPTEWLKKLHDLRLVLHGVLPDPGDAPASKDIYTDAWRGLWRLVNVLQDVRGFHVDVQGLDTLDLPDMSVQADAPDGGPDGRAWMEARTLCDETFHLLIDALISAGASPPDLLGDDIVVGGRVVSMMEFGWSERNVAVAENNPGGTGWHLISFDPAADELGEAVTKILQALEGAKP